MSNEIKVAVIGLDTSHAVQFVKRMQAPDCEKDQKVEGLRAVACMRFATPFQDKKGLDDRQKQLEEWGVHVTCDFDEAVADCDAVMLEINDPAYHLEYFKKCAVLGKPIFLDKPMADTIEAGSEIYHTVMEKKLRVFSSSCLRSVTELKQAARTIPDPMYAAIFGPLGTAPTGSSIVWYGVHAFEMLEFVMGRGAVCVLTIKDEAGYVIVVKYPDKKRGVVELVEGSYEYGGTIRTKDAAVTYTVDMSKAYTEQLSEVAGFFYGGDAPLDIKDTLEVMNMLDAAERSLHSGKEEGLRSFE